MIAAEAQDPLILPVRSALESVHSRFAIRNGPAVRYPADVTPFAALDESSSSAMQSLAELLSPGEHVYIVNQEPVPLPGLSLSRQTPVLQMLAPPEIPAEMELEGIHILSLDQEDAGAMVALTDVAFPGFFRPRTNQMGAYYGIRIEGALIAMAGERMAVPGLTEISGVCTHPAHVGGGYARMLMIHVMRRHADAGLHSFLHVTATNSRAVSIYERLGFTVSRTLTLWTVTKDIEAGVT